MSRRKGSESIAALVNHWRWLRDQGPCYKPQASSSLILDPRYMDIEEVLGVQGPRVFAKINVLLG